MESHGHGNNLVAWIQPFVLPAAQSAHKKGSWEGAFFNFKSSLCAQAANIDIKTT
jgi:hypothetical protein